MSVATLSWSPVVTDNRRLWLAIGISLASIGVGWVIYDQLCKSKLGDHDTLLMIILYAVVVFGLAMAFMAWRLPRVYPPLVELGHFIMVATMLPAASLLAARIAGVDTVYRIGGAQAIAALQQRQLEVRPLQDYY